MDTEELNLEDLLATHDYVWDGEE
ncbi:hypothetical protein SEA_GAIL_81 [Mycobacterium phage Gail]|uniref:Uncharacterized protein n=1 Tax=Mycobacterium phage Gail TaxID=2743994 RepID=A0A7D5G547_9CAUD|nr:hypothetical protein KNV16_gp028 [Mycobacterium phage Gail]QLF84666.1 hypothetical protein SEA_GAIL_81 [Mycobacterium phage Gail]